MEISFGALESYNDKRTIYASELDKSVGELPPEEGEVDINFPSCNDLCNQRKLGICTACGTRMAVEEARAIADTVGQKYSERLSEYWLYLIGKLNFDGNLNEGSSALTMLKASKKIGVPSQAIEAKYPLYKTGTYEEFITDFKQRYGGVIPFEVLEDAKKHTITGYYRVEVDPISIAREIQKGKVIVTRFAVGDNTYKDKDGNITRDKTKLSPLRPYKKFESGHIWCIYKYKGLDENQVCTLVNSWSRNWCDNGSIDFVFKTQKPYFTEAWAIGDIPTELLEQKKANDFKVDLKLGMTHVDVKRLQQFLNSKGFTVAMFGDGSKGKETEYFGSKTKSALIKFQKKHNIPATGFFGTITRGIVNSLQ